MTEKEIDCLIILTERLMKKEKTTDELVLCRARHG